jgi:hypothetical protein
MTEWIESKGGPLAVVPESWLGQWRGVAGPEPISHYQSACEVRDEIEVIRFDGHDTLILGDEPLPTFWQSEGDQGGILARVVYADSEEAAISAISEAAVDAALDSPTLTFSVDGPARLIDSADSGDQLFAGGISLNLQQGTYRVQTGFVDSGPEVRVLIHRLRLI